MNMKKMVSIFAAALLLLTGCADSSSVQTPDSTEADAPAESLTAESTGLTGAQTDLSEEGDYLNSTGEAAVSGSQTEAVSGTSAQVNSGNGAQTVTTAAKGGQSAGSVTTSAGTQKKKQLITDLSALSVKGDVFAVTDAGNGKAVVGCSSGGVSTAYVIDTVSDRLVTSFRLMSNYESLIGVNRKNELIGVRYVGQDEAFTGTELHFYDLSTGKAQTVTYSNSAYVSPEYDAESDTVCGLSEKLYSFGRDGSVSVAAENLSADTYILRYAHGICLDYAYSENTFTAHQEGSRTKLYTVSGVSGQPMMPYIAGSRLICETDFWDDAAGVSFKNGTIYDLRTGKELHSVRLTKGASNLIADPQTDYALYEKYDTETWCVNSLMLFDAGTGKRAKNEIALKADTQTARFCWLKDSAVWAAAVSEGTGDNAGSRLFLIDPSQANITQSFEKPRIDDNRTKKLGAALEPLHEITDRILNNTGVHVLIGNEIFAEENVSTYVFTSCEDEGYSVSDYRGKLLMIEKELNRYPKDFFRKYIQTTQYGSRKKGLRLFVPIDITTPQGGGIPAGGVTWESNSWYNVAVRISTVEGYNTALHHELWHSVDLVMTDAGIYLYDAQWHAHNPKNFSYDTANYEDYFTHSEYASWNLKDAANKTLNAEQISFIRDYGIVRDMEDSATIMEGVFDTPWHFGLGDKCLGYKYQSTTQMIADFPHLQGKLDLMAAAVKKLWGYVYWEQMVN